MEHLKSKRNSLKVVDTFRTAAAVAYDCSGLYIETDY